ncbi:penicillin-insensitive murein endopeptidase [Rhodovulum euryhalinum]|uniref:Murein endopeptidase n=1 Tax=Rhodovulum euryhalinum TaxID=35805 RepID=A0A4R2KBY1_9RHOB|nr:penicillin-insensitive murein endopeptidase [Rhodovulum euryhalinum]TCO69577.1 murein endopeptidase [Rhodovulum euryhalinum]
MARILIGLILGLALAVPAAAQPPASALFGAQKTASNQPPAAIGTYAKGCAAGLVQLPESGPTWQAMRLSRNRNWGHPETIAFIRRLSAEATRFGWRGLYVGDISQPRGGPMTSGHASHQIGLDVDIWMLPPARLNLSRAERESISSISVRSEDQRRVNGNFTRSHAAILRAAAMDRSVDRIFVTPPVKIEMCRQATRADRAWLQKIRPLYGHNTHFHVRLKCPPGERSCETQRPTVADLSGGGDGCDETLTWWVTDYLDPPKTRPGKKPDPAPKKSHPRDYTMADLPAQCRNVLAAN